MPTDLDPLAHRVAHRHQAAVVHDPMVLRVVARYLAWCAGELVDVDEDEDELPVSSARKTGKKIRSLGSRRSK